jgi:(p)ppGpp synthase/HD superfamily hydrolase
VTTYIGTLEFYNRKQKNLVIVINTLIYEWLTLTFANIGELSVPVDINKQLELCKSIARKAHINQFRHDKVTPYITHVEKVAKTVGKNKYLQCIAWLHDVVEDTHVSGNTLIVQGVESGIVARVMTMTHYPRESYNVYIQRIRDTRLRGCVTVKIADIVSNLSDTPTPKQVVKYYKAIMVLGGIDEIIPYD